MGAALNDVLGSLIKGTVIKRYVTFMLISGLSRGHRLLKGAAVVSPFRCFGWCNHASDRRACEKSKSQIESVMAQTESVAYMTNFVRCHIETQFHLHKYSPVHLKM